MEAYVWSLWPDSIPTVQIKETQRIMCWAARWQDQKRVQFMDERIGYREMLEGVWTLLDDADALVSWNGRGFDSKHVRRAFAKEEMRPPSPWREIDLMQAVKSQMKFASNKLDHVAQELGIGKKTKHEGFTLWEKCMAGDPTAWRKMKQYNIQDVNLLVDAYDRLLPWIPNHPNVSVINGTYSGCSQCGSTDMQRRGFSYTNAGVFQRYLCNTCGHWDKDPKRIATVQLRSA
jgi:hypothetical protein